MRLCTYRSGGLATGETTRQPQLPRSVAQDSLEKPLIHSCDVCEMLIDWLYLGDYRPLLLGETKPVVLRRFVAPRERVL